MALDTTVAGATADAYISAAEADVFAANRLGRFSARWLLTGTGALTVDQKENAILQATVDVDAHIRSTIPYSATQRLAFPRTTDYIGTPAVPFLDRLVKEATYEQAAFLAVNADLLDDAATRRARGMFSFNDDDVSGSLAVDSSLGRFSPRASMLLRDLGGTGHATVRSVPMRSIAYAALGSELLP